MGPAEAVRRPELDRGWARSSATALAALVLAALVLAASCGTADDSDGNDPSAAAGDLESGQMLYEASCATCHGIDLRGTDQGPPFLDAIYAPNHHPDEAFFVAVTNGVQPHHWNFGSMPAQEGLSDSEVTEIVAYVRATQEQNGITFDSRHG